MHFRLIYTITDGFLGREKDGPITFSFSGKENAKVTIRAPSEEEKEAGHKHPCCEASIEKNPDPSLVAMFESLDRRVMPKGSDLSDRPHFIDEDGKIDDNMAAPYDLLPNLFKGFERNVISDLRTYLTESYKLYRWRDDLPGKYNPFSSRGAQWSLDGSSWKEFPDKLSTSFAISKGIAAGPKLCKVITALYKSGTREPLAHELFREAFDQKGTNPRSSLILGVTAAEAALKNLIADLQPQTEWLVQNMPSPSIVKIIDEYVPKLPLRNKIGGKESTVPSNITGPLKKAVQMRNIIVHGGHCSLSLDSLIEILDAVKDLLWLLDYFSGHKWALDYVSDETKTELGI